jgi:hypothetical protein
LHKRIDLPEVRPATRVKPPNFVIGDLNATVGQHVTFWHANWTTATLSAGFSNRYIWFST